MSDMDRQHVTDELAVPTADVTTNVDISDIAGNKIDAAATTVGTTKTLIAYTKGLIQELDQRTVAKASIAATSSTSSVDVLNINDKGVLTGILQMMQDATTDMNGGQIILTIDGTIILSSTGFTIFYTGGDGHSPNNSLTFNHRFDTSLRIQHKIGASAGGLESIKTIVAYTIDS